MTLNEMKAKYQKYCNNILAVVNEEWKTNVKINEISEKLASKKVFEISEINEYAKEKALLIGQAQALHNKAETMRNISFIDFEEFSKGFEAQKTKQREDLEPMNLELNKVREELVTLAVKYQKACSAAEMELIEMANLAINTDIAPPKSLNRSTLAWFTIGNLPVHAQKAQIFLISVTEAAIKAGVQVHKEQ